MMRFDQNKRSWFVWSLVIGLLLINGLMAAPSVSHAAHHSSHKAGTHGSNLCAWECGASQGIEAVYVCFESALEVLDSIEPLPVLQCERLFLSSVDFRGPPHTSR